MGQGKRDMMSRVALVGEGRGTLVRDVFFLLGDEATVVAGDLPGDADATRLRDAAGGRLGDGVRGGGGLALGDVSNAEAQ